MKRSTLPLVLARYGRHSRGHEPVMVREVEEGAVVAVQPRPVAIPVGHYGAHVVVEHLAWDSAEVVKRPLVAGEQRLYPFIGDELDVGCPPPAERRDEHREPIGSAPDGREVGLRLAPRRGGFTRSAM